MIKPPLLLIPAAFAFRAAAELIMIAMQARRTLSPSGRVGFWSTVAFAGLVGTAVAIPGGVTWQTFVQFPQIAHTAQVTAGRTQLFNFSLSFIILHKLDQAAILSLNRWIDLTNLLTVCLVTTLFALRLGRDPLAFHDIAPGLLLTPFVLGAFWSYYAAWFLPYLLWLGWLTLDQGIPPLGQATVWIGLALSQVFSSPLFLVGVILLLLGGDYSRLEFSGEEYARRTTSP